ncbi:MULTISPECIES: aminotransferase class I/II-fold pyridoxal phosphate-dependent enzyme [unclassified Rudaea]|uniref:aminotransferase class I/II-fold pyridoxal phosphate-dependent enzyme n=1 Tax=unclassified Rudaea TaxID=2627037 RepID=UPI0020168711|nr:MULTISPECIES: aminotransferase class I/II-fold pyridoxal phosphate-dependent enzyme [unclassified Rudaea]
MSMQGQSTRVPSPVRTGARLENVRYEIRGALARRALELEAAGRKIAKLNIGNPSVFGFTVPDHVRQAIERNLVSSEAYCHQKGLVEAREAIVAQQHKHGIAQAHVDRIFIGNGVSELIDLALRSLLSDGDEVLLPSPDYPLWSAAVTLNGGRPVYYTCPAEREHTPDAAEIEALITNKTRAVVLVNPNNPTGAIYPRSLLETIVGIAERHGLVLLSDEIYDEIVYDNAEFTPLAKIAGEVPCLTFDGLSKVQRACGYRVGWLSMTGAKAAIEPLEAALDLLASLRLCANVAGQYAIAPSLEGPETIAQLVAKGGRLYETRAAVIESCATSRFLDLVAPKGAMYAFPSVRADLLPGFDDETFALDLLENESVLIVPGRGFNCVPRNHFRITLLPLAPQMREVFARIERVLERMAAAQPQRQVA